MRDKNSNHGAPNDKSQDDNQNAHIHPKFPKVMVRVALVLFVPLGYCVAEYASKHKDKSLYLIVILGGILMTTIACGCGYGIHKIVECLKKTSLSSQKLPSNKEKPKAGPSNKEKPKAGPSNILSENIRQPSSESEESLMESTKKKSNSNVMNLSQIVDMESSLEGSNDNGDHDVLHLSGLKDDSKGNEIDSSPVSKM